MKKILLLTVVTVALLFSGCARKDNKTTGNNNSSTSDTNITQGNSAALSGEITAQDITDAKAKEIALAKVPGAKESDIREFEKERDDGKDKYEGKIYYEKQEYEFEIDARSGEIIKWEVESVNW